MQHERKEGYLQMKSCELCGILKIYTEQFQLHEAPNILQVQWNVCHACAVWVMNPPLNGSCSSDTRAQWSHSQTRRRRPHYQTEHADIIHVRTTPFHLCESKGDQSDRRVLANSLCTYTILNKICKLAIPLENITDCKIGTNHSNM